MGTNSLLSGWQVRVFRRLSITNHSFFPGPTNYELCVKKR